MNRQYFLNNNAYYILLVVIYVCIVVISLCYDIQEELQSDVNGRNISLLLVFKLLQLTHFLSLLLNHSLIII